jgi:hypothetical protein
LIAARPFDLHFEPKVEPLSWLAVGPLLSNSLSSMSTAWVSVTNAALMNRSVVNPIQVQGAQFQLVLAGSPRWCRVRCRRHREHEKGRLFETSKKSHA